ncbi:MAG TPA: filamentous hemagglutinin family protein [Caulobacteraceae bacterium]|nr:filamentous hemagglutinin family protein [Caulobacteraceae bacterium]
MTHSSRWSVSSRSRRRRLFCGASVGVVAALAGANAAQAQTASVLHGAAHMASATGVPPIVAPTDPTVAQLTPGMQSASARALANQARAAATVSLALQAQSAARAAAAALARSVPDGLGVGGLDPIKNPLLAANDPTGLSTWEGASQPTQSVSGGQTTVTIDQTQALAVLDWTTFNIGRHTTLDFNQTVGGVAQKNWIALNRVVGQIDPATGLRDPNAAPSPSQILGRIKSDGEVFILNPNGVIFGGSSQVNTYSLVATSLDIGRSLTQTADNQPMTIQQRNESFLQFGMLGYAEQAPVNSRPSAYTLSGEATDPTPEGAITVEAGAQISSADNGFLIFAGPKVTNAGVLSSPDGEVALLAGRQVLLQASDGSASAINPNIRGLAASVFDQTPGALDYVHNSENGVIRATDGAVLLLGGSTGAVINDGALVSTTSVSRNGYVQITGLDVRLGATGLISITPDGGAGTIPQDPTSLSTFKSSRVDIGGNFSRIDMDGGDFIYAPSGNVTFGAAAGPTTADSSLAPGNSRIFIDDGASIDVAGLTHVMVPASRNSIAIDPVTLNELSNSPEYRDSFLNGAKVYVDPRLSGVDMNGVAWVGSPLIPASSFAQQVGVSASELMTKAGAVTLGVASYTGGGSAPDVIVKAGATIDISGGWVTYQAGWVKTTRLIDAGGAIVDISNANPDDTFIGIYNGYNALQPRWGVSQSYGDPIQTGASYEAAFVEGRDAGSLTIKSSAVALDGTLYAAAYAGPRQLATGAAGSARSALFGDGRRLQGAPSQLPSGGFLSIQAVGVDQAGNLTGGGDIEVTSGATGSSTSGLAYGQGVFVDQNGNLVAPPRDPSSLLPTDRLDTISLSAPALSASGLADVSLETSGALTIDAGANLTLQAGGEFDGLAGRALTVDGSIDIASGRIGLVTAQLGAGSVFTPTVAGPGSFDITVNGTLSTRGRWVNDYGASAEAFQGAAYLNGGSITLEAAPSVLLFAQTTPLGSDSPSVNTDISGSILINQGARVDVSGGGYVTPSGNLSLTGRGGNLSLIEQTAYFQLNLDPADPPGAIPGFRVSDILTNFGGFAVPVNPDKVNASVFVAPGAILADGFAGGGTFTLITPQFQLAAPGDPALLAPTTGTVLSRDFFSASGFANFNVTSYKTDLIANQFDNGLGGFNEVLQTQVVEVQDGEALRLFQSRFSPFVDETQAMALRGLATGGDLYSLMTPSVPTAAWDQLPVNLTLGGLIELKVDAGGEVLGAPGSSLTVSQLYNAGVIRLPGGALIQSEILPTLYAQPNAVAVGSLSQVFSTNADGTIDESGLNLLGLTNDFGATLTNAQVAAQDPIYLLGDLAPGVGAYLAPGSVTDLSGVAIVNPRAKSIGPNLFRAIVDGTVLNGGELVTEASQLTGQKLFAVPPGLSVYSAEDPATVILGGVLQADGATIDVSGASATFDRQDATGFIRPTREWSDGGAVTLGGGALLIDTTIHAAGGAPDALGGTLTIPNLVLTQSYLPAAQLNALSADAIEADGFATLVDQGSLTTIGDVDLKLDRAFILTSGLFGGLNGETLSSAATRDALAPTIGATGNLSITAAYVGFASQFQSVSTPLVGSPGDFTATFNAKAIDVVGAVRFDQSLANVDLNAAGDLRLVGSKPWQQNFNIGADTVTNSLAGQLAVNGDLTITAAQIYPTTGSSFIVSSAAAEGVITFAKTAGSDASTPYSAGGSLLVQASQIVQGGVARAPLGTLTFGSNTPLVLGQAGSTAEFAPQTSSVELVSGSITSVGAEGLAIPYGTTTDQTEWFFSPTNSNPLTAPPAALLKLVGAGVSVGQGANVDVSGGGDVYAYEFIPGTGGSHDVLSQFSNDPFTSNNGFQYPDHRQVYAIVPGLSSQPVAALDPIYGANYGALYGASGVGSSIYLSGGPGVPAGWYTLLPAQYAMLPGGMRVVQDTGAPIPAGSQILKDGTVLMAGTFGDAGAGTSESTLVTFEVQTQRVFEKYSNIALTSGNAAFAQKAAQAGVTTPRLPIDAGQLVLTPLTSLDILSPIDTAPGAKGRGALVDVSGANLDIVADQGGASVPGAIVLTAGELSDLNAASLFIGGVRTQNSDGTVSLDVTAQAITVENDAAHPLSAPELILAVDGPSASISVAQGAGIVASGQAPSGPASAYVISGSTPGMTGQGALLRVASGPAWTVRRTNQNPLVAQGELSIAGGATLDGASVLLDSSGDVSIDPTLNLTATNLGIDAGRIAFSNTSSGQGLTITPQLAATFAKVSALSLSSQNDIAFDAGDYAFGNLSLDAPGLALSGANASGLVSLEATNLTLSNSFAPGSACAAGACGSGELQISASQIGFGDGKLDAVGFGHGVSLTATGGIFAQGVGGLDVGDAAFSIAAPFIGDKATPSGPGATTAAVAGLTLASTGDVSITNPGGASASPPDGVPGASLIIEGGSISVTGAELRATAGVLTLKSATGVSVGDSAKLETPGYQKQFGDASDPYEVSAPGGVLSLLAADGDIDVASGAHLSIGGGKGRAGQLNLLASGAVTKDGSIDAAAPDGKASLSLSTGSSLDLATLFNSWGAAFDGDIALRSGAGDLVLAAGQKIHAANLSLAADGGLVDIAGAIDVSGVNGGNVGLFGAGGVTLESGSRIFATASGYAVSDTREARGGAVDIGASGDGVIDVRQGALIDVAALRPGARFVRLPQGGDTFAFVAPDQGGSVVFRAPVIESPGGAETVHINFAGAIKGASAVAVDAYKSFDLGEIASSGDYVGVTQTAPGVITLDTTAKGGRPNFLADNASGTVVDFVQNFDLSAARSRLGGLTRMAGFSEQAGIQFDYSGSVVLASNWNLGAGVVDVTGAVAAGLMAPVPNQPGKFYVLPGNEGAVFSRFTSMTYRAGGAVDGAPGVLTIRAGGDLTLNGSITDGFFTFADQTDPTYLDLSAGGGNRVYQGFLNPTCFVLGCGDVASFDPALRPTDFVSIVFPSASRLDTSLVNPIPYNPDANAPGALGAMAGGAGDPIGSAQLFPLIDRGSGSEIAQSWSYQLVGGAATGSANPLQVAVGATGRVVVQGLHPYQYVATTPVSSLAGGLDLAAGDQIVSPDAWLNAMEAADPSLTDSSYTVINLLSAPASIRSTLASDLVAFFKQQPTGDYAFKGSPTDPTGVATSLKLVAEFFASKEFDASVLGGAYKPPTSHASKGVVNAIAPTLIRTGTGSISITAASDVDLRNGATPTLLAASGAASSNGFQLGGVAIYTAGHAVDMAPTHVVDSLTGAAVLLDASGSGSSADPLADPSKLAYQYGDGTGFSSILIANPTYAAGGGDISVTAGGDVLGRRDVWLEARLGLNGGGAPLGFGWIGNGDQAWRTGVVGPATDLRIDPQLFQEGLGTLGGGDITVKAGGDVSDLSVVSATSVATAQVSSGGAALNGQALVTFGGGDVTIQARGALLGGRIDVGSGAASIAAGQQIAADGLTPEIGLIGATMPNALALRLSDATVSISAGGDVLLQGIRSLGVRGADGDIAANLDSMGFYSANARVSIIADGSVTIENSGLGLLTQNTRANAGVATAVYPGSLTAVSLNGDLDIATPNAFGTANSVILYPSRFGTLTLAAAGQIGPATISMDDSDPSQLPGAFTNFTADTTGAFSGHGFVFPNVQPNTLATILTGLHASTPTHAGDETPNRIYAGGDIANLTLSMPKQTRIGAGNDIINMVFVGQNVSGDDVTRIVSGRDITATTTLTRPVISATNQLGNILPTLQGDTFMIGGPGSFFLEAGRNAGPFLNSAVTNGFVDNFGQIAPQGTVTYGGGILSVGNGMNPWLPQKGADIYTEFGVAKGQDFQALIQDYLNPANLASMPDYLFQQTTNAAGFSTPDRSKPIYGPVLVAWMQANAAAALVARYGRSTDISFQQAYDAFIRLPRLRQETFLLKDIYFDELAQTSIPSSVSFLNYSRGYLAVNTLFPASLGYTQNDLSGGSNGANSTVETGNLDLRLSTIQTDQGGDIFILGPGGRVLAGSTVATATQAAQRAFEGGLLLSGDAIYAGGALGVPLPAAISSIPAGDEGILTLRGGSIYAFTDGDFLLNQSRLFTEGGGNVEMWSSNGDLNAGEGQKTTAEVPPVVVTIDQNGFSQVNQDAAVSGAGIGAFLSDPNAAPPSVFLIAPRGTVDAGAAGIRVAGDLFIAANSVANATNIEVGGTSSGVTVSGGVSIGAQTSAGATAAAQAQAAQAAAGAATATASPSLITVIPVGSATDTCPPDDKTCQP